MTISIADIARCVSLAILFPAVSATGNISSPSPVNQIFEQSYSYIFFIISFFLIVSLYFNFKFYKRHSRTTGNSVKKLTGSDLSTEINQNGYSFEKVIESSPVAISVIDNAGNALSTNKSFIELFGYSIGEFKKVSEWFVQAYPDANYRQHVIQVWNKKIEEYNKTGIFLPVTAKVRCKNGEFKTIEFNYSSIGDSNVITFVDLTARKELEEKLIIKDQKLQKQNEALISIIVEGDLFHEDFQKAISKITEICASLIETERISVWFYSQNYEEITCIDLYQTSVQKHSSGMKLKSANFQNYVNSHRRGNVISVFDVYNDQLTQGIPREYFSQNNIHSLMDVPIWLHDKVGGLLSCEHTNSKKKWTTEEERFLLNMTTIIAICFEINERQKKENAAAQNKNHIKKQYETILNLILDGRLFQGDFKYISMEITEICAGLLNVERVGIWLHDEKNNLIRCIDQFQKSKKFHCEGDTLNTLEFPKYIEKLKNGNIISAYDVYSDPAVNEIPESYYKKYDIFSMLDAPFWHNEKISGIICLENTNEKRQWTPDEEKFVTMLGTLLSLCFEVSERKKAEDSLKTNENQLNALINSTPDIICFKDGEGRWLIANNSDIELFNLKNVDYKNKKDSELANYTLPLYKDSFLLCESTDEEAWRKGSAIRKEEQIPLPGGGYNIYDIIKIPIFNHDSSRKGLVIFGRDTTERKRKEEELKISETKFRTLFQSLTEGVAIHEMLYDADGKANDYKIIEVNPAFEKLLNISAAHAINCKASELYQASEAPYLAEYEKVVQTGVPFIFNTYFQPMDKYFYISALSYKKGQFVTVFNDVTNIKRNEDDLKRKNEEMTKFIYTVSHDLKNPLVTIRSFTDFLKQDLSKNDEPALSKDFQYIHGAADKMELLLNELLELSRIGRKVNPKKEIPLINIVKDALELISNKLSNKNIEFTRPDENIIIYGDNQRLVELYKNLIDNAVKFMGSRPDLKIEIGVIEEKKSKVLFVKDNGTGIDQRYQHKLFGLFEKLDPHSDGTGMGLAISKKIVETHDGKIWAVSEGVGKGTIFYFTLGQTRIIEKGEDQK